MSMRCFTFFAPIWLIVVGVSAAPLSDAQAIYAVFHNETGNEVKVRIEAPAGYSVFGVAPGGVHTERIHRGGSITVTTTDNRRLTMLEHAPFGETNTNFDTKHRAYYYRISDHAITNMAPRNASGWWVAGLPQR
jgi:hypothetical protein